MGVFTSDMIAIGLTITGNSSNPTEYRDYPLTGNDPIFGYHETYTKTCVLYNASHMLAIRGVINSIDQTLCDFDHVSLWENTDFSKIVADTRLAEIYTNVVKLCQDRVFSMVEGADPDMVLPISPETDCFNPVKGIQHIATFYPQYAQWRLNEYLKQIPASEKDTYIKIVNDISYVSRHKIFDL